MSIKITTGFRATDGRDRVLTGRGRLVEHNDARGTSARADRVDVAGGEWRIESHDTTPGLASGQVLRVELEDGRMATAMVEVDGTILGVSPLA